MSDLIESLRGSIAGTIRAGAPGEDDHDASHYRIVPAAVLEAADPDDLAAAVVAARTHDTSITMRGGGTSLGGQSVGAGLLVSTRGLRACTIDPEAGTATVGPGVTLDALNAAAAAHGRWFGPDVSSSAWATIGGMIGNDSCGTRSGRYGRTSAHIASLDLVLADGSRTRWTRGEVPAVAQSVGDLLEPHRDSIMAAFPPLPRRVAGYALDRWVTDPTDPGVLAGSEGTLALIAEATVRLVERPTKVATVVVSARGIAEALDAVDRIRATSPASAELIDGHVLARARAYPPTRPWVEQLDEGTGALVLVEYLGDGATASAIAAMRATRGIETRLVDGGIRAGFVALRRAGLGLLMLPEAGRHPASVIEDLAVPPDRLPAFVEALSAVLADAGLEAAIYGHASVGCLHVRPWVDLAASDAVERMFDLQRAATRVALAFGGTSTGEHGDGRIRSHLLDEVYPAGIRDRFADVKSAFDPDGLLGPGIIVEPASPREGFDRTGAGAARARAVVGLA